MLNSALPPWVILEGAPSSRSHLKAEVGISCPRYPAFPWEPRCSQVLYAVFKASGLHVPLVIPILDSPLESFYFSPLPVEALRKGSSLLLVAKHHCPTANASSKKGCICAQASLGRNFLLCTGKAFCAAEEQEMVLGIGFACGAVSSAAPQCSGIAIPWNLVFAGQYCKYELGRNVDAHKKKI